MVTVRPVIRTDAPAWRAMRQALWPDEQDDHTGEIEKFFAGRLRMPLQVLLAVEGSSAIGFVELSIRAYAEGCQTDRVAFLEGWYVVPEARRKGVGRALVAASENWGRAQGCTEFGSDAVYSNTTSQVAHKALGFEEVVQIRCFKKDL